MLHVYSMIPESSLLWLQSWQAIISCNSALSSFSSSSLCFALLPPALLLRSLEIKNRMTNWHLRGMVITGSHMFKGYKYQWCAFDGWKGPTARCVCLQLPEDLALSLAGTAACSWSCFQPRDESYSLSQKEPVGQGDDIRILFLKFVLFCSVQFLPARCGHRKWTVQHMCAHSNEQKLGRG